MQKVQPVHEQLIAHLRKRKLAPRKIQNELKRLHPISLSTATIHKILEPLNKPLLKIKRAFRKQVIRYNRPVPCDRVQMDVCKIAPGIYQYTAIDDCTRYKVLRLYSRRTANNTMDFLMLNEFGLIIPPGMGHVIRRVPILLNETVDELPYASS